MNILEHGALRVGLSKVVRLSQIMHLTYSGSNRLYHVTVLSASIFSPEK